MSYSLFLSVLNTLFIKIVQVNNYEQPTWGRSLVGRARALQARGQEFDSPRLHQGCYITLIAH